MSGIPNHKLALKIDAPIICLRNIDQRGGLCNFIPDNGTGVSRNSGLKDIHQSDGFSFESSAASNFAKLEKFEGVDFQRWQKNMHFLLSSMSVVYVMTTPMPEDGGENPTVEQVGKRMLKLPKNYGLPWRPNIWMRMPQDEFTLIELGSHLRIEESFRAQDNDKPKGNNVVGPSVVNMVKHNNSSRYNDNKGKRKHHDTKSVNRGKKVLRCHTPRRGLDGIRVRRRDFIEHLKYKA
ncbi:hypothetical protein Tco_1080461 [Tanacetum coccineum]|uniref:DNA helicase Pif1-like 2B domain-containing protein n=1 Tax=Tanacetum coccineum TaxID=301880 RepID=A0ABQ5HVU8_9ASTR